MRGIFFIICVLFMEQVTVFNFKLNCDISNWNIVDDVVMGGRSAGDFNINKEGHGVFSGEVSLENNGGFSSVRYNFTTIESANQSKFVIKLRGDGKTYQFRVKDKRYNRFSYISEFNTSGEWQTIEIPFSKMFASFRGYRLDIPNFEGKQMQEIAFLIANKKAERFKLIIDSITIE